MSPISSRRFVLLWAAILTVVLASALAWRFAYLSRPTVLVCDFDSVVDQSMNTGSWDLNGLGRDISTAIIERLCAGNGTHFTVCRPQGGSGRVRPEFPASGIDYIVSGSFRLTTSQKIEVAAKISGPNGRAVRTFQWFFERRHTDWIVDRTSWDTANALCRVVPARPKRTRKEAEASIAYAEGMRLYATGMEPDEARSRFADAQAGWPDSPEPERRRAFIAWRQKILPDTIKHLTSAVSRAPDREILLLIDKVCGECLGYGWSPAGLPELARRLTQNYPLEGGSWSLYGHVLNRTGKESGIRELETGVLLDLRQGHITEACVHNIWLAEAYERRLLRSEQRAAVASSALRWKGDGLLGRPYLALGWRNPSDEQLLEAALGTQSPGSGLLAMEWLTANRRTNEAEVFLKSALEIIRRSDYPLSVRAHILRFARDLEKRAPLKDRRSASETEADPMNAAFRDIVRIRYALPHVDADPKDLADDGTCLKRVESLCRELLAIDTSNRFAANQLASLRSSLPGQNPCDEVSVRDEILRLHPRNPEWLFLSGRALLRRWDITVDPNDVRLSEQRFIQAVRYAADQDQMRFRCAWELAQRGVGLSTAEDEVERLHTSRPSDPETQRLKGWLDVQRGSLSSGRERLYEALNVTLGSSFEYGDICGRILDACIREGNWPEIQRWCNSGVFSTGSSGVVRVHTSKTGDTLGTDTIISGAHSVARLGPATPSGHRDVRWFFNSPSVIWTLVVDDIDGDAERDIILGTGSEGAVHGMIYTLDANGRVKWRWKMGANPMNWCDDQLWVKWLTTDDVDNDGRREVVACATHHPQAPSRLSVLDGTGRLEYDLWNNGTIGGVFTCSVRGRRSILFHGVNNDIGRMNGSGWPPYAGLLSLDSPGTTEKVSQTPPGSGRGIKCCAPAELTYRPCTNDVDWPRYVTGTLTRVPEPPMRIAKQIVPDGSRTALVLGIGGYKGAPLRFAADDANKVATALDSQGYRETGLRVLTDSTVTAENIRRVIRDWNAVRPWPPDTALVYFSGHGFVRDDAVHLALAGARSPTDTSNAISLPELMGEFGAGFLGRTIVVVLDCCLTGAEKDSALSLLAGAVSAVRGRQLVVWYACRPGDQAMEYETEDWRGGLFTQCLVESLYQPRGVSGALDRLTLGVLSAQVSDRMSAFAAANGSPPQYPMLMTENTNVVIATRTPEQKE